MNNLIGQTKLLNELISQNDLVENILVHVDSRYRNKSRFKNPGYFIYNLNETFKNITYIRISSIELPTTNYTFANQYNNTNFIITLYEEGYDENGNAKVDEYPYKINIEEGNYDSDLIVTYIQNLFTNINNDFKNDPTKVNPLLYISWDQINYKITIQSVYKFTLTFDNDDLHESLGAHLGYLGDNNAYLYNNQSRAFDATRDVYVYSWTGENFLHVNKDQYCFLKVNDYGVIYNTVTDKSLLAKILLYDGQFVFDTGSNFLTKMYKFKQPVNISNLEIELINQFGKTIDMGNVEFSMTLELGQLYNNKSF